MLRLTIDTLMLHTMRERREKGGVRKNSWPLTYKFFV